jgi:aspartyl-tRNA(Asn)/glutamyl-tRNA(Gln) amidotransferase subunit C
MPVSRDDVIRTAQLAKLSLSEGEVEVLRGELSNIFQYIDQLHEVNTDNVEPLHHVLEMYNVLDEDRPHECLPREQALREAPDRTEEFFHVPRVIE